MLEEQEKRGGGERGREGKREGGREGGRGREREREREITHRFYLFTAAMPTISFDGFSFTIREGRSAEVCVELVSGSIPFEFVVPVNIIYPPSVTSKSLFVSITIYWLQSTSCTVMCLQIAHRRS